MNVTEVKNKGLQTTIISNKWVKESMELLDKQLGKGWRQKYIVWDCTADQKEIPEQDKFKRLYRSATKSDNPDIFDFDFLNDGATELMARCPELHMAMSDDEPIVFLFDVPKERATLVDSGTKTKESMKSFSWGMSSRALYAQYFYRIYIYKRAFKFSDAHIGAFAPATYLSSSSFKKFREKFFQEFHYETGFVFDAACLDSQKEAWALSFVHFSASKPTLSHRYPMLLKEQQNDIVVTTGSTSIYNLDQEVSASMWVRVGLRDRERNSLPEFSSAMTVRYTRKKGYVGQVGTVNFDSNSVANNHKEVMLASSTTTRSSNVPIMDFNWQRVIPLFAARRCVDRNWENWQQEYRIPDTDHPIWPQYVADSLVYSIFDVKSRQTSLGNVLYNDRNYDIRNEFFWINPSQVLKMFVNRGFDDFYKDYLHSDVPYFQKMLDVAPISEQAEELLHSATQLFEKSVDSRIEMHANRPEWQLHRWDAGYAQLKRVWMRHHFDDYTRFRAQFEEFRQNMKERTYVLGFLG